MQRTIAQQLTTIEPINCNCCNQEKEEYVTGICKERADKMDKHILEGEP